MRPAVTRVPCVPVVTIDDQTLYRSKVVVWDAGGG